MALDSNQRAPSSPSNPKAQAPPFLKVWLSAKNCSGCPLKGVSPLDDREAEEAIAAGSFVPYMEIWVHVEKERLIGYRPHKRAWPWQRSSSGGGSSSRSSSSSSSSNKLPGADTDSLPLLLRMPLFHARVCHIEGSDASKWWRMGSGSHAVSISVPTPTEDCGPNKALRIPISMPQPRDFAGTWLFTCGSQGKLEAFLGQLQAAGCTMSNLEEHYSLTRVVGSGASSKVYVAEDLQTGGPVAVKVVKPDPAIGPSPLAREATILRRACHPNILQFLGIFRITDIDSSMKGCWAIVTEFINGGELFAQVRHDGPLPESRAQHVSSQVLSAIAFLHERGIVHRDIKTENIILVGAGDEIKIVDFGLATPEWDKEMMAMRCGSPGYVAPEVLRGETYDCTVDCFSIGVLLYILLSGRAPFSDRTLNALLQKNLHCKVNPKGLLGVSESAKDLVMKMLSPWPSVRPAAAQCLIHPWFDTTLPSLEGKPKPSECRTGRRMYSKALPYEDIFHSNLRFHTTDSPPNGVPVEKQSTSPMTVSDPLVEVHHLSPTVSIEVLSDHMLKSQQATAQQEETPKCSTPPLATPRTENSTGIEELRSVTPIWAEAQQTLVSLQRQGPPEEVSEYFYHSENDRNDIRISFAHSQRAPSERTSKFFTLGSDSDDEDLRETFNTDLDAAFDTSEGPFIADMNLMSSPEFRGDARSLHGVNRPALPGSVSGASSSSREAWTRRLGAVAEPTSSTDSGRTRRLGGAAFRSPVASMQNTPDPSDIDSPGGSPWMAWTQRGGTHGTAWPTVASEQCFGGKGTPTSAASSGMTPSEAQLSQLSRLSRGSPKYKPLFAEVERKLARLKPHFLKQRANAHHPRFQQMQFKEYAGYRKAVGDDDDRVSAVYGRDMKSESNDGAFKERLSAFYMRDLLGGKAAATHWDSDSQSESIAGDTLGVLPAERYSEDLPGMLSLFEPAQPASAFPSDMPNYQRPGATCNPAGACRRNSSSTRGHWTERPSLS